jgi:7-cyano-7-deazaguanine synthase in queuosine biosynthesis
MIDIVMFSGGLDSVYLLWDFLNKGRRVHAHHVSLKNPNEPGMTEPQDKAALLVKEKLIEMGFSFKYTESKHEFTFGNSAIFDSDVLCLHASQVCKNYTVPVTVNFGWIADGLHRPSIVRRFEENLTGNLWTALRASARTKKVAPEKLSTPLLDARMYKKDIVEMLPRELLELSWSCRKPVNGSYCRKCVTCKQLMPYIDMMGR